MMDNQYTVVFCVLKVVNVSKICELARSVDIVIDFSSH